MEGITWHGYLLQQRTELVTQQIPFTPRSFFTLMCAYNQNLTLFHTFNAKFHAFGSLVHIFNVLYVFMLNRLKEPNQTKSNTLLQPLILHVQLQPLYLNVI